ncbi:MAG TPA: GNAT family N-acetyltransferase, partial [Alphaproteobacteria bacterium]|nr:GNAT family N-acetyltransferase [Alphaproteobacteria bacterium]
VSLTGTPGARTVVARDVDDAARLAAELGGRIALKILSSDITHKSDVGGVVLDLGPEEVRAAAEAMLARINARKPGARVAGFTVQEMVRRGGAHELILGVSEDRQFGPVLLFGQGGTAVEVLADRALALPPLNLDLAHEMMSRTRVFRLLRGYRDRPPAALEAIALSLLRLSQLVCDLDQVVELDINPLLADAKGVVALDARVKVRPPRDAPAQARLAIRPYPRELETRVEFAKLGAMRLRPVRPEDEPAFHRAFERLSPEDVRMRFFAPLRRLSHEMAARLTQIDYDREMAFVLETLPADGARAEICGVVRLACDPDGKRGEFAVIVRSDLKGHGLGAFLMRQIIDYARARGVEELFGDILHENAAMRRLCLDLGFTLEELPETSAILRATLELQE